MIKLDIQHLILSKYKNQAGYCHQYILRSGLECTPNDLLTSDKNEWDTKIPSHVTEYIDRMEHISQEIQDANFRYRAAAYHKESDD